MVDVWGRWGKYTVESVKLGALLIRTPPQTSIIINKKQLWKITLEAV
jgi:hypothetical protein